MFALGPTGGDPGAVPLWLWLVAGGLTAGVAVICSVVGWRRRRPRAALLGVATGTTFGLISALISEVGAIYSQGGPGLLLTSWQTYAAVVVGPTSFFLLQNALQAGSLVASQPGFTLANPLVAVVWGLLVFGGQAQTGIWLVGSISGGVLLVVGTILLSRSPVLSAGRSGEDHASAGASSGSSERTSRSG